MLEQARRVSVRSVGRLSHARGSATSFGTFGELLQGVLPERSQDFLVTMPVARWSRARFAWDPRAPAVRVLPPHKTKSRRLAELMLRRYGLTSGGNLLLDSDLPVGKGLASSSADLVATARAVSRAIGESPTTAEIESLMRAIEPSDGVMYDGVVAFYHREVRLRERLGHLPPLTIVGVDEGGQVETVAFNRRPKPFSARDRRTYDALLTALCDAVRDGDAGGIGEIATRSAVMNQRLCPKRTLAQMLAICREMDALGVVTAHSGTAVGVLLADDAPGHECRLARTRRACAALTGQPPWVDHSLPLWRARGNGYAAPGS